MKAASSIYEGWVMHRRLTPRHHRFKYSVFALLLDLDELAALDRGLRLFKYNRFGVFSFHDRDHGPRKAEEPHDLRRWLDGLLADAGISARGPRRVLCYPRIFGYVFNPLSVWFCHDEQNALKAIVYEIHNTYEERHTYVLPVPQAPVPGADRHEHRPGKVLSGFPLAVQPSKKEPINIDFPPFLPMFGASRVGGQYGLCQAWALRERPFSGACYDPSDDLRRGSRNPRSY